jgi:hypothetical protein
MQLRFLQLTGPRVEPAVVDFGPGLNVIYGGSNTGKSHILRLIDYVLGARLPVEPVPEQAGYDIAHLGIVLDDGVEHTLIRALQGGDIKILDGLVRHRPNADEGQSVSAKHSAKSSLSKKLLAQLGAPDARIRTNASGTTRDLSFRDLAKHAIITELKIQDTYSPIVTGQYISRTAEASAFKFMLTGVDDSALDIAKPDAGDALRQAAQVELLDRQIRELSRQIEDSDDDHDELAKLDLALDTEISEKFVTQEAAELTYRQLSSNRRELRSTFEFNADRIAEIETLLARFRLLSEHYESDKSRLQSIAQAGQFFVLEEQGTCPVCGAKSENHRPEFACDGDVSSIIAAATAEERELAVRTLELATTIQGLEEEKAHLESAQENLEPQLDEIESGIKREIPSVQSVRAETNTLIQKKIILQRSLDLVNRHDALVEMRDSLGISPGYDSTTIVARQQIDGATLDEFCQVVETELKSWSFPDARRVFFEMPKLDISVSGKSRAANGKGVRALLHGAFTIALLKFCKANERTHPGFALLDSLFITYQDPVEPEDKAIAGTPLKDRAFKAFADVPDELQLIIFENVDVPDWLAVETQCVHFTGRPGVGRAGFFPLKGALS